VRACPDVELRLPSGMAVQRHRRSTARGRGSCLCHIATRSRARRSVKSGGSSEIAQKASCVVPRLVTSCGQPWSPGGLVPFGLLVDEASAASRQSRKRGRFSDGRHLGRSRPRSSSRKGGRGGPRPPDDPAQAGRRGSASSYPSRGWGSCGGIVEQRRSLQPARQRCHDERCPSGSGWGTARSRALARACGRGPLARETSAGGCRRGGARLRPRSLRRAALPVLGAERGERSARAHAGPTLSYAGRGSGGRRSCSRIELVAEVDERRLVLAERPWV
jgi:hypothetical protein